jgi:hypothetical protein
MPRDDAIGSSGINDDVRGDSGGQDYADIFPGEEQKPVEDYDWWEPLTANLMVDGVYNFFRAIKHIATTTNNPGLVEQVQSKFEDPNDPLAQEYINSGGAEKDGFLNSDGTLDMDGSGDSSGGGGDELYGPKALAKLGMNKLWNDEINADSPYEKALGEMGLKGANTASGILDDMASGEFQLPAWMKNISDKNFKNFTESTTRRGAGPGSTAYGQGSAAFNLSDQESATKYGFGMLGLSSDMALNPFNSLNANKNSEYSNLFGISGNSLIDQPNQKTDSPKWWETALDIGSDIYTTSSLLNR